MLQDCSGSRKHNNAKISSTDFAAGLKQIRPSITNEVEAWYEKIKDGVSNVIPKESDRMFYG